MIFAFPKSIFHQSVPLKFVKTMLIFFTFVRFISSYSKSSYATWATKRSVIAYDEIEDSIRKE